MNPYRTDSGSRLYRGVLKISVTWPIAAAAWFALLGGGCCLGSRRPDFTLFAVVEAVFVAFYALVGPILTFILLARLHARPGGRVGTIVVGASVGVLPVLPAFVVGSWGIVALFTALPVGLIAGPWTALMIRRRLAGSRAP